MYARVVKWEGQDGDAMRASATQINEDAASGPPEGLPASGLMVLIDPDGGRSMAITFFGSEEDRAKGHEVLEGMSPPGEGMGSRTGVEMYEVAVDIKM